MANEQNSDKTPDNAAQGALNIDSPGAKLRHAREAKKLSLQDVASRTRVAIRQLEAIERDDFETLPGIPYAIGFARAYARAVGVDEVMIAAEVREAVNGTDLGANRYEIFEPADPARVPSRTLAWTAAVVALVVIVGFGVWRTQMFTAPTEEQLTQEHVVAPATDNLSPAPRPPAVMPVVLTAIDDVWLRIYDDAGERMKDGMMAKGESFTVPTAAKNPMILTGRPQALSVSVGGKVVAPLGPADRTIADVPISAAALLARAAPAVPPGAGPAASAPSPRVPAAASVIDPDETVRD